MCGRYTLTTSLEQLQLRFSFSDGDLELPPRYNVAPTQTVLTVVGAEEGRNRGEMMRWGLVPSWAKDISVGNRMINARAETLGEKSSFRRPLQKRRCLVLADGFYEWQGTGKSKTPVYVALKSKEPFGMAGLWEAWKMPSGDWLHSCTIITTTPNSLLEPIHNRMPTILTPERESDWLDQEIDDTAFLINLLQPYPAESMQAYPVSRLVNSPSNDAPECIEPVENASLL